jgi:hypothetical protein
MIDWFTIIGELKCKSLDIHDFPSAAQYREIQTWLTFNHKIEEIFEVKDKYNSIVKKELVKLERMKKLNKIQNENEN